LSSACAVTTAITNMLKKPTKTAKAVVTDLDIMDIILPSR
jgi:hypothetical protein